MHLIILSGSLRAEHAVLHVGTQCRRGDTDSGKDCEQPHCDGEETWTQIPGQPRVQPPVQGDGQHREGGDYGQEDQEVGDGHPAQSPECGVDFGGSVADLAVVLR